MPANYVRSETLQTNLRKILDTTDEMAAIMSNLLAVECNRQRSRRIDIYEIIVLERSGTFQHYFVRGVLQ